MDDHLNQLGTILNNIAGIGVYVIGQDTHEILYFNDQIRQMIPEIALDRKCHGLWPECCSQCPIFSMDNQKSKSAICRNELQGTAINITATKILWNNHTPAYLITNIAYPISQAEQETALDHRRMSTVLAQVYPVVISVNLSSNTYSVLQNAKTDTIISIPSAGVYDELMWMGYDITYPSYQKQFLERFHREYLLKAFSQGEESVSMDYLCMKNDWKYHWTNTHVLRIHNPYSKDILCMVLTRNIDSQKQKEEDLKHQLELEQERTRYRMVMESTEDMMFEYDVQTDIFTVLNPKLKKGQSEKAAIQYKNYLKNLDSIEKIHINYRERMKRLMCGETKQGCEVLMRNDDNSPWQWFLVRANNIYEKGKLVRVVGILSNIDEVKKREEEHAYLERICKFTVNNDYDLVMTVDLEQRKYNISCLNLKELYQMPKQGIYSNDLRWIGEAFVHPDDRKKILGLFRLDNMAKAVEQEGWEAQDFFRILSSDKIYHWKRVRFTFFENSKKIILIIIQDIQEFQEAKSKELAASQMFVSAVRNLYEQIYEADLIKNEVQSLQVEENGNIIRIPFDRSLQDELQYREKYIIHPDDRENYRRSLSFEDIRKKLDQPGQKVYFEIRRLGKDGCYRWYSTQIQLLSREKDSFKVMVYLKDIDSVRREDERQKQALQDALFLAERANHAKSEFISRMSHDIRTPMNAILGMTTIALTNLENKERICDNLNKINTSAEYLLSLINDILDMSKIESGKLQISPQRFHFYKMLQGILALIQPQATAQKIELQTMISQEIPAFCIGDELRINQILVNLLSNAIKYTPEGGHVCLQIQKMFSTKQTIGLRFIIEDNGIGMSKEFQKKMFDPFEQEEQNSGRVFEGTGLGMAITKNLVQLMNGEISVESETGKGTRFVVDISVGIDLEKLRLATAAQEFTDLQVMLVDNDTAAYQMLYPILQEQNIKLDWIASGSQAMQKMKTAQQMDRFYDIVIAQWGIFEEEPLEAIRNLRALMKENAQLAMMFSKDWSNVEASARLAGCDHFLTKPLIKQSIDKILTQAICLKKSIKTTADDLAQHSSQKKIRFRKERVLLVEDNEINMEIAQTLLEMHGLIVEPAYNGQQAIELFSAKEPGYYDVILMDIRMPIMDGATATKKIRALDRPDAAKIPIVAMTANAFHNDEEYAKRIGMNGYIIKPIDVKMLFDALDQLLHQNIETINFS